MFFAETPISIEDVGIFEPIFEAPREQSWRIIPLDGLSATARIKAHRWNGLGSLFYFTKVILRKRRLTAHLHLDICLSLERTFLKDVFEIPRDHFKSTICSEAAPIWWALPFTDSDEFAFRAMGYKDEFITWMRRAHNQDTRTLLVSANITNAAKLGKRINGAYDDNDLFRACYPEILPSSKETWSDYTKFQRRTSGSTPQGEGTYDFLGVGSALQSRHYDRIIQDDLVGKDAINSETVMESVIDYHRLLVGAFDSDGNKDNDELIVGNRWSDTDLSCWVRENEPYFRIMTHSAEGGCCVKHPIGQIIFPEEFNWTKLKRWERRLGSYLYSCQFQNRPKKQDQVRFDESNLNYYELKAVSDFDKRARLVHCVTEGLVMMDMMPSSLNIQMICDPNHGGAAGRCKHAVVVVGALRNPDRLYLLDCWADSASYDELCANIYRMAKKWHLRNFYLETNAAQKYLKYHLEYRSRVEGINLKVDELPASRGEDAKWIRIDALEPVFNNRLFWIQRSQDSTKFQSFLGEYKNYYRGTKHTVDILDTLGYALQVFDSGVATAMDIANFMSNIYQLEPQGQCGYDG